jgi:hypothetical protein
MISAKQQAANERNAQKSTGPATAEGRDRSSRNATTHGLASREALLASEDAEAFQLHMESFLHNYRPKSDAEKFYVIQMAEAAWRLRRVRKFESAALDSSTDPSSDETVNKLIKLSRYEAAIERTYYRALRELKDLLKVRVKAQKDAVNAYIFGPIPGQPQVPGINMENTERTHSQRANHDFEPQDLGLTDPEFQRFADRLAEIARTNG